jgi:hypothetical protein
MWSPENIETSRYVVGKRGQIERPATTLRDIPLPRRRLVEFNTEYLYVKRLFFEPPTDHLYSISVSLPLPLVLNIIGRSYPSGTNPLEWAVCVVKPATESTPADSIWAGTRMLFKTGASEVVDLVYHVGAMWDLFRYIDVCYILPKGTS